nr:hypothetical protein [Tanacetum cinerariifolium]
LKKTFKKSKLETYKLHASGSGDGVGSQLKLLDEQVDKTTGTDEGTDSGDDESNDDDSDEVTKDDDEDDVKVILMMTKKQVTVKRQILMKMRILILIKMMKKKKNMKKNTEYEEQGKEDKEMTDVGHDDSTQQTKYEQVKDDEHITLTTIHDTKKIEGPMQSSSMSFDFVNKFLNLDNVSPTDTEVVFIMNINVLHEEPST